MQNMTIASLRRFIQAASTVLSNSYIGTLSTRTVNTNMLKGICVPFLNCYACPTALFSCPIGTMQHFMAIHTIPYYLLAFIALIGFTIGRMACGWVCPFGFLQDFMYMIKSPKIKIPYFLSYMKYVILILFVIVIPYNTGQVWFSKLCPAGTLTAGIPWTLWNPTNPATGLLVLPSGPGGMFYMSLLLLIGFMLWFVLSKRPFCRVVCPMGTILSLFNRYSMVSLSVGRHCDGCDTCRVSCPMDLNVSVNFNSGDCIRCLECTRCGHVQVTTSFPIQREVHR